MNIQKIWKEGRKKDSEGRLETNFGDLLSLFVHILSMPNIFASDFGNINLSNYFKVSDEGSKERKRKEERKY